MQLVHNFVGDLGLSLPSLPKYGLFDCLLVVLKVRRLEQKDILAIAKQLQESFFYSLEAPSGAEHDGSPTQSDLYVGHQIRQVNVDLDEGEGEYVEEHDHHERVVAGSELKRHTADLHLLVLGVAHPH